MKKQTIIGITAALALFTVGAAHADACSSCDDSSKCKDLQTVWQLKSETTGLASELKAKNLELQNEFARDRIDARRTDELEREIRELKSKINATGDKLGIPSCCNV